MDEMNVAKPDLAAVIMAGGAGTRFWPVSTEAKPKQFLNLFGQRTLIQLSLDRVAGLIPSERILVLTNERFVPLVRQQLPQLPPQNVVGEPMRRDTAAAIALAALICRRRFGDPVMAVLTADHLIEPVDLFQRTLLSAAGAVGGEGQGCLYTFGIKPSYPATGFGYLQRGELVREDPESPHFGLRCFKEKPDLATAQHYVESGEYYWNSGMFVWRTSTILDELGRHLPQHLEHLEPEMTHDGTPGWQEALRRGFEPLLPISIDFAVMEKAARVRCVASGFDWSDVGGWLALEEFLEPDGAENRSRGRLFTRDAGHNLVFCEEQGEVVTLVGVKDLVVVRAGNRTLVVERSKTEQIKQLVQELDPDLK